ncbi:MAG: 6-bladed beta-propeller [candidate division KSB1 bacterium]|nr:6-bladed beta-propeller [candidate division KSB1 bacterium]
MNIASQSVVRALAVALCMGSIWVPRTALSQSPQAQASHVMRVHSGLKSPVRIAIAQDQVYVVDSFLNRILKFDLNGQLVDSLSIADRPLAIAVNPANLLYIGNRLNGRLQTVNFDHRIAKPLPGSAAQLALPTSATFDDENHFYVVDSKSAKIVKLDAAGNVLSEFGQDRLVFPTGIAFDVKNQRLLVTEHGGLNLANHDNDMIYAFSKNGTFIHSFGKMGSLPGRLTRAQGLAVDRFGRIYVVDPFQARVNVYSENGEFLAQIGTFGREPGQFRLPMDVAIDAQNRIWVVSMNNGAIEVFDVGDLPTPVDLSDDASIPDDFRLLANFPNPFKKGTYIPFALVRAGEVTIRIYNEVGTLIRAFQLGQKQAGNYLGSNQALFWDGRDSQGRSVASGLYFYEMQFERTRLRRKMLLIR